MIVGNLLSNINYKYVQYFFRRGSNEKEEHSYSVGSFGDDVGVCSSTGNQHVLLGNNVQYGSIHSFRCTHLNRDGMRLYDMG